VTAERSLLQFTWFQPMRATILLSMIPGTAVARPVDLCCNYLSNPLGIDSAPPILSWRSNSTGRNWLESAYQIHVASSLALLRSGQADVWDSGKRSSSDSVGITYGGGPLSLARRYYRTVRVWDRLDRAEDPAEPPGGKPDYFRALTGRPSGSLEQIRTGRPRKRRSTGFGFPPKMFSRFPPKPCPSFTWISISGRNLIAYAYEPTIASDRQSERH
jgi:hypothetical protein